VETNWLVDHAAPAHHRRPGAATLLERALAGDVKLYLPAVCLAQARSTIPRKFQPRREAEPTRLFLAWARTRGKILPAQLDEVTRVLNVFEQSVQGELRQLGTKLDALRSKPEVIEIIGLDDEILERAATLSTSELCWLDPFDQAILAAVLVHAARLRTRGRQDVCFCELDSDLQPWDRNKNPKPELQGLYDDAGVWVYGDYDLTWPEPPRGWTPRPWRSAG
jgi:hypothetical protein